MAEQTPIDEYIAQFPDHTQHILKEVRQILHEAIPNAAEKISYGVPTLTLNNTYVIYFGAYPHHFSIYPVPDGDAAFQEAIAPYRAGKGTLRFALDKPVPHELIKRVAVNLLRAHEARQNK